MYLDGVEPWAEGFAANCAMLPSARCPMINPGGNAGARTPSPFLLEHDPEKWEPVFGKRSCSNKELERDDDSKRHHPALREGGRSPFSVIPALSCVLRLPTLGCGSRSR